jgi:hypothetical protein
MKTLGKYSMGIGDRFGHQGEAQLRAIIQAGRKGIEITPVWNKSDREHMLTGTHPSDARYEADDATRNAGFNKPYHVDADHIKLDTVDRFITSSDFFTIDIAEYLGRKASDHEIESFMDRNGKYIGKLPIPGLKRPLVITKEVLSQIAGRYLYAASMAGEIYRKIEKVKGEGNFITEISMDEVDQPQSPVELFFMLEMISDEKIPIQTVAPKFPGRMNKGIDYIGDPSKFSNDFETILMVIEKAIMQFPLPGNLKISLHSGSDKFSIYPHIGRLIKKYDKGIHVKTAGTTWLEEVIGLALSDGEALQFVKEIYFGALENIDELCAPYARVIDIDRPSLPPRSEVSEWSNLRFAGSLKHIPRNRDYNPGMRQLLHVAYKLAAARKDEYFRLLDKNKETVGKCVCENIYERHICRLFDIR